MANGKSYVYNNPRPDLLIETSGGRNLGNCYNATYYRVTSTRALSGVELRKLRDAGFLGYGQEFWFHQHILSSEGNVSRADVPETLDWRTAPNVTPSGVDVVPCIEINDRTGLPTGNPPVNPYSGKLYEPHNAKYFVYDCESRVDSGD